MDIQREKYYSIAAKNRPGELARITAALMEAKVYMSGVWGFALGSDEARIIAVPRDLTAFERVAKQAGWDIEQHSCFRIDGEDRVGALVDILNRIAEDGVNLQAVDAMAVDGHFGCYIWCEDKDVEEVAQVLGLSTPLP